MPLVNFKQNIKLEAEYVESFTDPEDIYGGSEVIFSDHPQLEKILKTEGNLSTARRKKLIEKYLNTFYQKEKKTYAEGFKRIETNWHKSEKRIVQTLCEIMNYPTAKAPTATAYVGSITIYPRDIEKRTFLLCFRQATHDALVTAAHEYTHFLYFDQWKKLFPQDIPEAYQCPHFLWQLSEILAVIINSDPRLVKVLPDAGFQGFYFNNQSYHNLAVPGTPYSILGYFQKIYLEHTTSTKSFESFLEKCRQEIIKLDRKMYLAAISQ